ncbi:unnamed protein product [Prorocentrum cordatum]|uniref:Calmodulin-lysine N-methyltransferase n=1 Tax=Prorocentrum cordatum TaxID=2364126 RepID=A0ABN9TGU3_9DINO|nr:unnamed protein product [Polarella glacialis]
MEPRRCSCGPPSPPAEPAAQRRLFAFRAAPPRRGPPEDDEERSRGRLEDEGPQLADGAAPALELRLAPRAAGLLEAHLTCGGLELGPVVLAAPACPVPVQGGVVSGSCLAALAFTLGLGVGVGRAALEIGAGRGLLGITLAHAGAEVVVTDAEPAVCEALRASVEQAGPARPRLSARELDWDDGLGDLPPPPAAGAAPLLLGAELLWADDADSLWQAVSPAVLEHGWEFVYGAADRPSNEALLQLLAEQEGTRLEVSSWMVCQGCPRCRGWVTLERCRAMSRRRTSPGPAGPAVLAGRSASTDRRRAAALVHGVGALGARADTDAAAKAASRQRPPSESSLGGGAAAARPRR